MVRSNFKDGAARLLCAVALLATMAGAVWAAGDEKLMIPVGHSQVIIADDVIKTVAIAEPKIADAAVGSERTVVVNGKQIGSTSLVVYGDGGRFRVYDIEVYAPSRGKQVALHVRVAEVNDRAKKELGFDLSGAGKPNTPGHSDYITGGLFTTKVSTPDVPPTQFVGPLTDGAASYVRDGGNFVLATTWRALQESGDIKILANPTIVATSGEKAKFLVGGELPIPIATGGSGTVVQVTIEWKEFGIKLDFTPTVEGDGSVTLEVSSEVSRLDYTNPLTLGGFIIPIIDTRKASTTVHMTSGEHLFIGGLKQTERTKVVRKVPLLGEIPLLNLFFSYTKTESVDRELMFVVSPEMIESSGSMPKMPTDGLLPKK